MMKKFLSICARYKTPIKFIFATLIIYWLIRNKTLDFSYIGKLTNFPIHLTIAMLLLFLGAGIVAIRLLILINIKSTKKISVMQILRLNWIGMFFSTILPGAVTGDLVKLLYLKDIDQSLTKSYLLITLLVDRVIGVIGLIIIVGFFTLFDFHHLLSLSPQMKELITLNILLLIPVLLFLFSVMLPQFGQLIIKKILSYIPLGRKISDLLDLFWLVGEKKMVFLSMIFMTVLAQIINLTAFWYLITPFLNTDLTISNIFTIAPIGFITNAIPITPAGIGVGHAAFQKLFSYYGENRGATLYNLYFLCWLTMHLFGVVPYLFNMKKISLNETVNIDQ